jgi:hypothetical protein
LISKIEVYVRKEKVLVGQFVVGPVSDGTFHHACLSKKMLEYEKVTPEADRVALEVVNKVAEEKGLQVEVLDVSTFKGRLMASLKDINKTPVIVIGENRIEGEQTPQLLRSKLESYLTG